jgi:hypothetical protein
MVARRGLPRFMSASGRCRVSSRNLALGRGNQHNMKSGRRLVPCRCHCVTVVGSHSG